MLSKEQEELIALVLGSAEVMVYARPEVDGDKKYAIAGNLSLDQALTFMCLQTICKLSKNGQDLHQSKKFLIEKMGEIYDEVLKSLTENT